MINFLEKHASAIRQVCREHRVRRLDVFGSILSETFNEKSDIDFLVEFELLGTRLGWEVEHQIVQTNIVSHTKADGFSRLAKQAAFEGDVSYGKNTCKIGPTPFAFHLPFGLFSWSSLRFSDLLNDSYSLISNS